MARTKGTKKKSATKKKTAAKKRPAKRTTASKTKAVRKSAKKSARKTVKKSAKKATPAKKAVKKLSKVKNPMTKSEVMQTLSDRTGLSKKEVSTVIEELGNVMGAHLEKGAAEKFVLSGLLKVAVKRTPAKKARKGINPFTGEEMMFKAKPAGRKVKITALKKLKELAGA